MSPESKLSWDQYLKLAAIPYTFGFLTIMFHTAQYGFPVVQVLQPLNFWVGAIPTVLFVAAWKGITFMVSFPWGNRLEKVAIRLGSRRTEIVKDILLVGLVLLQVLALLTERKRTPNDPTMSAVQIVLTSLLIFTFMLYSMLSSAERPYISTPPFVWMMERIPLVISLFLFIAMIFSVYLYQIYPALPQRYGFGRPANIKLVLDPKMSPPDLLENKPADPTLPVVSRSVKLLYRTDKEDLILCDQCQSKSLSITSSAVLGIIWEDNGKTEKTK
jgi:hypothetical protein